MRSGCTASQPASGTTAGAAAGTSSGSGPAVGSASELNYLSIPVNNKFYIGNNGLNFQIAPIIDILLNHKNVEDPQDFDIAIAGAIGYDIASVFLFPLGINKVSQTYLVEM
jgi:hypothetical protein